MSYLTYFQAIITIIYHLHQYEVKSLKGYLCILLGISRLRFSLSLL
uniref:Uncharacterized protein n=1 Tax=Anguilla anguilla TaxID=7936 RepID=A0A0E9WBQ0_ANGAN